MPGRSAGSGRREVGGTVYSLQLDTGMLCTVPLHRQLDEETLLKVLEERGLVDQVMKSLELSTTKSRSPKIEIQNVPRDTRDRRDRVETSPQKYHTHSHIHSSPQGAGESPTPPTL